MLRLLRHAPKRFPTVGTVRYQQVTDSLRGQFYQNHLGSFRQYTTAKPVKLTFFTKETCSLCTNADKILKETIEDPELVPETTVQKIDIMDPKNQEWYDKYCWDVPVLHVERDGKKLVKFMHYFYKDKLLEEFNKE